MIGDGRSPQHLLDKATLGEVVRRAIAGDFAGAAQPITLACPEPIAFRDLLERIARAAGRRVFLVPTPWRALYFALRAGESLGLKFGARSDSIVSFVHQNRAPDFAPMSRFGIKPARFPA